MTDDETLVALSSRGNEEDVFRVDEALAALAIRVESLTRARMIRP